MNGNKKINNLKRLVIIISAAILVVAVILIMSIYNNKFGKVDGPSEGGMSTVKTTTTDIIIDPDGEEDITNAPTTDIIQEDNTEPTTNGSNNQTTSKTTKSTYKTQTPTSSKVVITDPPVKYTVITAGGSGFANSVPRLEWALFNEINSRRSNKLKMATELRSRAETAANNAIGTYVDSLSKGFCTCPDDPNCKCDSGGFKGDGAVNCVYYDRPTNEEADRLIGANSSILDEDYEYIGIGVIQRGENFSYVVIVD